MSSLTTPLTSQAMAPWAESSRWSGSDPSRQPARQRCAIFRYLAAGFSLTATQSPEKSPEVDLEKAWTDLIRQHLPINASEDQSKPLQKFLENLDWWSRTWHTTGFSMIPDHPDLKSAVRRRFPLIRPDDHHQLILFAKRLNRLHLLLELQAAHIVIENERRLLFKSLEWLDVDGSRETARENRQRVVRLIRWAILVLSLALAGGIIWLGPTSTQWRQYVQSQKLAHRYANPSEIHSELRLEPASEFVRRFYNFREFYELIQYHPIFGYYAAGRVIINGPGHHYTTAPEDGSPEFGGMLAHHALRMMRQFDENPATAGRPTTIIEFGPGNGRMAKDFNDEMARWERLHPEDQSRLRQMKYVMIDISWALRERQKLLVRPDQRRIQVREGSALDPASLRPFQNDNVIVLANELLDAFPVYKIRITPEGNVETAFVLPSLQNPASLFAKRPDLNAMRPALEARDKALRNAFPTLPRDALYLEREDFERLMISIAGEKDVSIQHSLLSELKFFEVYGPASAIPELADDLNARLEEYAFGLSHLGKGAVLAVNPGLRKFMSTLDQLPHARAILFDYGESSDVAFASVGNGGHQIWSSPLRSDIYAIPSRQDWTSTVPWTFFAKEAVARGWSIDFFGRQNSMFAGTPYANGEWKRTLGNYDRKNYKVLILRRGIAPAFAPPGQMPQPLFDLENKLSPRERTKARTLLQRMRESLRDPAKPASAPQAHVRPRRALLTSG